MATWFPGGVTIFQPYAVDLTTPPPQNRTCAVERIRLPAITCHQVLPLPRYASHHNQVRQPLRRRKSVAVKVTCKTPTIFRTLVCERRLGPAERQPLCQATGIHQTRPIVIDPVVLIVAPQLRIESLPHLRQRGRQMGSKPSLQITYFRLELLLRRSPFQLELSGAARAAIMCETKEVESTRRAFTANRWQSGTGKRLN